MEQEKSNTKKWVIASGVALSVVILIVLIFLGFQKAPGNTKGVGGIFPFGNVATDTLRTAITGSGVGGDNVIPSSANAEWIFKQITDKPVAGQYALLHDGVPFVRYVDKETGHIFEANISDGSIKQLTNTTIPRIAEAYFGFNGGAVILRYLEEGTLSGQDVVKTSLGYLSLPMGSSTDAVGSLIIDANKLMPDNIIALSVSPNGKKLFYLIKTSDGVSGSIVDLTTRITKEVFRNSFSEWLPELLDNDDIILTTKPGAEVAGYSYRYHPQAKTLERILRNKNGLTTLANTIGSRIFFSENIAKNAIFGVYDKKGFRGDEGIINHEIILSFVTLPEKCAWKKNGVSALCASFTGASNTLIPDAWYQGVQSFNDTFWSINTETNDIALIADPKQLINQDFDVVHPTLSADEHFFLFVNKKNDSLWAMRVPVQAEDTLGEEAGNTPPLSPQEQKDAAGTPTHP